LTTDVTRLEEFLRGTEAFGGGDIPEAVYEGLQTAINEEHWSQGTVKVIIVFGDAPPHPENDGLNKVNNLITRWHKETGGVVSCIDTTGGANLLSEFKDMAAAGGGDAVSLARTEDIAPQLVTYIFGSEYKEPLEKLANYLNKKKTEDVNVIVGEKDAKP
jgi:Mg-chelatase subunit ChlD